MITYPSNPFSKGFLEGPRRPQSLASEYIPARPSALEFSKQWTDFLPKNEARKGTLDDLVFDLDAEKFNNDLIVSEHLHPAFDEAWNLQQLQDDWDGEGSHAFTCAHIERVCEFLMAGFDWAWRKFDYIIPAPTIAPGPAESIDIQWQTSNGRLLLNIPRDASVPITYYGEDRVGNSAKHKVCTKTDNSLFVWLMEML